MVPKLAVEGLPDPRLDAGVDGALRDNGNRLTVDALVARALLLLRPSPELAPPHSLLPQA
jgi:hypothetical protein